MFRVGALVVVAAFTVLHFVAVQWVLRSLVGYFFKGEQGGGGFGSTAVGVYVYEVPDGLLTAEGELSPSTCPNPFYSVEIVIPDLMKKSRWYRATPEAADYFMVPQYSTCVYNRCIDTGKKPEECSEQAGEYLTTILDYVETTFPFWQRKRGKDHIFIMSWDWASRVLGDIKESVIRSRIADSIHWTLMGTKKDKPQVFYPSKDISIPPLRDYSTVKRLDKPVSRSIFAYFRGTIHADPLYGNGVRLHIAKYGEGDPARYFVRTRHGEFYWQELVAVRYALCPAGWSHWSPRLFDAIVAGAIPVIIADEWDPAFSGVFADYAKFTVRVKEGHITKLTEILEGIPKEEEYEKRSQLSLVAQRFMYNDPPVRDDALDSAMQILAERPIPAFYGDTFADLGGNSDAEYTNSNSYSESGNEL